MAEKCISEVTVRLTDTLKRDLQDMAAHEDRTLSETIRIILETHLYGLKARHDALCGTATTGQTRRGIE
jgi:predicted transcriptional regulator